MRRRRVERPFVDLLRRDVVGQLNARDFLSLSEVDDGEAMEIRQLHEEPLRRAVGVRLERDWPDAFVEQRPERFVRLLVDDGHELAGD